MSYEHILVDIEDGVGIVTLNRPEKLNAMNRRLGSELQDAVKRLDDDDSCGCIVLTGAGRAFSAGGDIHEQLEDDARFSDEELDRMRTRRGYLDVSLSKKPNIGMMNGLAYGGAAVVASALAHRRLRDPNVPFRLVRRDVWEGLRPLVGPAPLAPSILVAVGAVVQGRRVIEVPITHLPRIRGRSSLRAGRLVAFSLRGLWQLLSFRVRLARLKSGQST